MKKKILRTIGALLLVTALAISLIPVSDVEAASSTSDFQMDGTKLVKYVGTAEVVSIPAEVRSIGEEAFANNINIVKVNINDKCKSIGYGAFSNCPLLHSVALGNGVEEIESAAFSNDKALKNFAIGDSLKKLGSAAFAGDINLTNLTVSPQNTHFVLKDKVLYNDDLTRLYFMLPSYGDGIYEMPNSVNEISGYAFWGNTALKNVILGSGLYAVPEYAFSNCMNLKEVRIPLPVRSVDSKAFEDCVNLSSVDCPDSLSYISDTAFDGCPNVTLLATAGSYADTFGRNLKKDSVDEVEYEDVANATNVSVEAVKKLVPVYADEQQASVVEGDPMKETPSPTPLEAKYYNGVINGSDVVPYSYYDPATDPQGNLLGLSVMVGNHALIFLDNNVQVKNSGSVEEPVVVVDLSMQEQNVGDIIVENAGKGIDFPKFTIVDDKIATQSYYCDSSLEEYEFPDGVESIGEFAFARSGLNKVDIPDTVSTIGYGAFYHCDNLSEVNIPDTVTNIAQYAFAKTPFLDNFNSDFVIVGDGILVSYKGNDSVVAIPEGVKTVADGAFKDHMGITAVNFPDSLLKIGEEAFEGCPNLNTLNRGDNITEIGANAFKGTSLSNITIGPKVESIGIGAFDTKGGTDTVTFKGESLPVLSYGTKASRVSNFDDRTYAFGNLKNAIVPSSINNLTDTILQPGIYGFHGVVVDEFGNTVSDNQSGVSLYQNSGITVESNSAQIDADSVAAKMPGDESTYILHISDSQNAKDKIRKAYSDLYGGKSPENIIGIDISLKDASDTIAIHKLGKQSVNVSMNLPTGISPDNLHVVTLDDDGQLEAVDYVLSEDKSRVELMCKHFSSYGFCNFSTGVGEDVTKTGDTVKDITPDTGDYGIHPKWFLAIGVLAIAFVLILLSFRKKEEIY